ncbi:M20/M25/M40 family metallo-hydrolase [Paenibacillus sp.]|uniref:M20/M25/M40 family metallo-hydrolase n=1 Tax=Paenibacillus sp. TaxID=58172 RepID=UPI0028242504|nr:M20/M25/M40 family metallo-hydrolase [Paenibacillus sp.]MDR0267448.1 M20/M25/M40 family metallo-hydrolase [Paenibacillus sp.]
MSKSKSRGFIRRLVGIIPVSLFIVILAVSSLWFENPPKGKGTDTAENGFSADRAFVYLTHIAKEPHTPFLPEHEMVRTYIVDQFSKLGLDVMVESYPTKIINRGNGNGNEDVTLYNIIATLKGSLKGQALMMSAHYDSVPSGPGANDDGVAVAALLETARALKAQGKPLHDILFVITDGEEEGLLGAETFWKASRFKDRVGMVANFEAKGASGPSLMFQTSDANSKLIHEFASIAPAPVSNSFLADLYRTMPNDTDLTVSLREGIPGLNFAYVASWEKYHTTDDSIENVSKATLQHHGENALAIASHFGAMDLSQLKSAEDAEYFNLYGKILYYPQSVNLPLAIVLTAALLVLFWLFAKKQSLRLGKIATGVVFVVIGVLLSALVSFGFYELLNKIDTGIHIQVYNFSFLAITLLIHILLSLYLRRSRNELEMIISAMFMFLILVWIVTFLIPGAGYMFSLPLLVHCIVLAFLQGSKDPSAALKRSWMIMILAVLPVLLFASLFHLFFTSMQPVENVVCAVFLSLNLFMIYPFTRNIADLFSGKKAIKDTSAGTGIQG